MLKQYGAIPFIREGGKIKIVLITSARGFWIFPKGSYEPAHGKAGTAALEAREEAGVEGRVYKDKSYRTKVFIKSGEQVHLKLYPLEVETLADRWPEDARRKRKVVSPAKARELISSEELLSCLRKFERDFLL